MAGESPAGVASPAAAAPPAAAAGLQNKRPPLNLANKPGEPAFQLKVEPADKITLPWTKGVSSNVDLKITNTTKDPQSYKVKCTDNNIFRVRPPLGFIEPGATFTVKIFQHAVEVPEENRHFFAIHHLKCTADDVKKAAKGLWKGDTKPDGVVRLGVTFTCGVSGAKSEGTGPSVKSEASKVNAEREKGGGPVKKEDEKKDGKKEDEKKDGKKEDEKKDGKKEDKAAPSTISSVPPPTTTSAAAAPKK